MLYTTSRFSSSNHTWIFVFSVWSFGF